MICIISGTNRPDSVSLQVAQLYSQKLSRLNIEHTIVNLQEMPDTYIKSALYGNQGKDEQFNVLKAKVNSGSKFIFVVPEYNGSFPGILKVFLDGLDYPGSFRNKKGALVGLGSGTMGGALALSHLTDILNYLGLHVMANKPRLTKVEKIFIDGEVKDTLLNDLIDLQIKLLLEF
jgi:NAD(P)H-dependent FMN reductase